MGDQGIAASGIAVGFRLFLQAIPFFLHQPSAPLPFPMMTLNWIGLYYWQVLSWFFCETQRLRPLLGWQSL